MQYSDSNLAKTDRAADRVWQVLGSSEPDGEAYCDSFPYPYASGPMNGPAEKLVARASEELGCKPTTVDGLDDESSVLLACDIDGDSYVLEIAREIDLSHGPSEGLEVGLYKW